MSTLTEEEKAKIPFLLEIEKAFEEKNYEKAKDYAIHASMSLWEANLHHTASMLELAKTMGEDVSDEPRFKWVNLMLSEIMRELIELRAYKKETETKRLCQCGP